MGAVTENNTTHPSIYVACLAAYNNGYLHGAWIDAAQELDTILDAVRAMLEASPIEAAEEWAIHDYEGYGGVRLEEYTGLDQANELALFIVDYGDLGAALLDHYSGDLAEAREAMADRYLGAYASLAGYMEELTEETTKIPPALLHYIDYNAMARDAELNGDLFTIATRWDAVHVFAGG